MNRKKLYNRFLVWLFSDVNSRTITAFLLLPVLLPSLTIKKKWKPSKIESKDAFFLHASSNDEAIAKLTLRKQRLQEFDLEEQPIPVVVGEVNSACIGQNVYTVKTPLSAVDICCKVLFMLKVELPPDSFLPLLFLRCYIFGIDPDGAREYQGLQTLQHDLMLA